MDEMTVTDNGTSKYAGAIVIACILSLMAMRAGFVKGIK